MSEEEPKVSESSRERMTGSIASSSRILVFGLLGATEPQKIRVPMADTSSFLLYIPVRACCSRWRRRRDDRFQEPAQEACQRKGTLHSQFSSRVNVLHWTHLRSCSFSSFEEQGEEGKAAMEPAQEGKGCQEASSLQAKVCQYDAQGRKEGLVIHSHGRRLSPIGGRSCLARLVGSQGLLLLRAK